jgi:hypothetical protein
MRKLAIGITAAVALLLAGILAWNAQATPLTGATTVRPGTNSSLVEKACSCHYVACWRNPWRKRGIRWCPVCCH